MYAFYKQLHPPTGIEYSVYCNFYSSTEKNLVIAGSSQLQVYRLNSDIEGAGKTEGSDLKVKKQKLECIGTFSLFGNIVSMEPVTLSGAPRDALLLSFKDAKMALLEYDPGTHDLKTTSLHYFEDDVCNDGKAKNLSPPIIRVDPDNRCAVILTYGLHLAVLPFRKDTISEDVEGKLGSNQSPVLSSYLIDVRNLDEKLSNIIDIQFLHGYYEPTLFILYEPMRTWSGRIAVRQDTCSIVAISLNILDKVHPVIWSLSNLPYDCTQTLAIPKPIGGVLVFAVNSLLYLNQSFPPYGVAVNSITDFSTGFPLKPQEDVKMSLDCAQAAMISHDRIVMSLKGGELYVLTLLVDGMRSVRNFNFDKAAASVLTTSMCTCGPGYLFLGSRVGNSLLLKYTEKDSQGQAGVVLPMAPPPPKDQQKEEPPNKKKRLDTMGDWMASDVSKIDDLDELEVYGSETQTGTQITSYTFEVCDSLMNIAPCGRMVMGEPAFLSEEFSSGVDPDIELVMTSGYAKNGALSVLQRSIRPQVVTTFDKGELPGCYDMWTVMGPPKKKEDSEEKNGEDAKDDDSVPKLEDPEKAHAFLILSKEDSSMILETGQEIMELDHSGFSTQAPTVYAGNVGDGKYILQVSPMGVRLLEGVNQVQHIPIDVGSPITQCSVADPYIILMSESGTIMLLLLKDDYTDGGVRLAVTKPSISQKSRVLTFCAYKDVSGMFSTGKDEESTDEPIPETPVTPVAKTSISIDDEDDLLYGEADTNVFTSPTKFPDTSEQERPSTSQKKRDIKTTYWAAIVRENGLLEIYLLPDFRLAFLVKNFPMGHKVLVDSGQLTEQVSKGTTAGQEIPSEMPLVKEILIVGLGNKNSRPYLFAKVDDDLHLYEAYKYRITSSPTDTHLKLRFKRVQHELILREKRRKKKGETGDTSHPTQVKQLRYFEDVSGYSGVFVCGSYPHWLFMTSRGSLRFHPMSIDGAIVSFTSFHNINCPKGFLYFNRQGELRICVLPTHLSYDSHWPIRKVPLRCTPHFVIYHPESKTYCVVTSNLEMCMKITKMQGDEKEVENIERDERFLYPSIDKFSLQLFSPVSWEAIPNTRTEFEEWEHVTCLANVFLKSEETVSGLKGLIAVGTNVSNGEEVTSRGRILVFDVIEVVPEPGQPLTKNKTKLLYQNEQKGPVTAITHVNGFLVTAIGQKIYIWTLKDDDLSGVAFIDTQVYIHNLITLKNLILCADLMKSISLLRYQADMRVLSIVSRDVKPLEVYGSEFMVDNTQLGFVVSDKDKNIIIYGYQPEVRESFGGQRLIRKADINVGAHINTFFRVRCKLTDPSATDNKPIPNADKKHITFFATLDGGIGYLLPITEKVYRRLFMLQTFLTTHLPHIAGLNPKAFRNIKQDYHILTNPHKNILDGELLWKYINLGIIDRTELAKKIGTSADQILDDLMEIDRLTAHF